MLSSELEFCLNEAFQRARDQRHEFMTVEHLLLALLDIPQVHEILKACNSNITELRRQLTETLHAFAQRLRACDAGDGAWVQVSDWYLQYAELRYCKTIGAEHLEQLHQRAERLRRSL